MQQQNGGITPARVHKVGEGENLGSVQVQLPWEEQPRQPCKAGGAGPEPALGIAVQHEDLSLRPEKPRPEREAAADSQRPEDARVEP